MLCKVSFIGTDAVEYHTEVEAKSTYEAALRGWSRIAVQSRDAFTQIWKTATLKIDVNGKHYEVNRKKLIDWLSDRTISQQEYWKRQDWFDIQHAIDLLSPKEREALKARQR